MKNIVLIFSVVFGAHFAFAGIFSNNNFLCKYGNDNQDIVINSKTVTFPDGGVFKVRDNDDLTDKELDYLGDIVEDDNLKDTKTILFSAVSEFGIELRYILLLSDVKDKTLGRSYFLTPFFPYQIECRKGKPVKG